MLNRIRRLWANVVGYFDVWQQLADAKRSLATEKYEHDHTIRQRDEQWAGFTNRVKELEAEVAHERHRNTAADDIIKCMSHNMGVIKREHETEIATLKADAIEHARDAETIAQLRTDLNHLKHANATITERYREACELLTHRNATCEHYRRIFGEMQKLAETGYGNCPRERTEQPTATECNIAAFVNKFGIDMAYKLQERARDTLHRWWFIKRDEAIHNADKGGASQEFWRERVKEIDDRIADPIYDEVNLSATEYWQNWNSEQWDMFLLGLEGDARREIAEAASMCISVGLTPTAIIGGAGAMGVFRAVQILRRPLGVVTVVDTAREGE